MGCLDSCPGCNSDTKFTQLQARRPKEILSLSGNLLLSIITPSLNRAHFIADALESVSQQDISDFEHLIIDGGSTDGTLEVLEQYPHLRVFSQPDYGIYDALNKGILLSQGEVIGFLNTDDLYEPVIFGAIVQTFADHPDIEALVGGARILQQNSKLDWETIMTFTAVPQGELLQRATQGAPIFNAWFFRRRLFEKMGEFDLHYQYAADRDLLIRMAIQSQPYASLDKPFYQYRMHPGSFTLSGQDSGEAGYMFETRALAERYIRSNAIRPAEKNIFRTWHSQITAEQIVTAWRKTAILRIAQYISVGFHYNFWGWPEIFFRKVLERFKVFLDNHVGRKTT